MQMITRYVDVILQQALILLMVALVTSVSWQVISRYVFSSPSSWTEEVARFLLIWIGLLGAAYAFRTGVHLGLDILPKKLSGKSASVLEYFILLVVIGFAASVLVVGGGNLVLLTWELKQYSAVLGLPIAFVYSVIPLSGALICLFAIDASSEMNIETREDPTQRGR